MNDKRKYFLYLLIACISGFILAVIFVFYRAKPIEEHPEDLYIHNIPFKSYVYGVGTVMPKNEEIKIFSPLQRRIIEIFAQEGSRIKVGEPLIQLYNEDLIAELAVRKASLAKAKQELKKLQELPKKEDLIAKKAVVNQAYVAYNEANRQLSIAKTLYGQHAISEGELNEKIYQTDIEKAKLQLAIAQLNQTQKEAWEPDIELAKLSIDYQARLVDLERKKILETTIFAPINGTVLKLNSHPGEMAIPNSNTPLMIVGNISECYVTVAVDENDVDRITPDAEAVGFFRERNAPPLALEFVRIVPLMTPKKSLTGTTAEKVDTRVLSVIYRFKECGYINQLMDVYINQKGVEASPK